MIGADASDAALHLTVSVLVERGRLEACVGADAWAGVLGRHRPAGPLERAVAPFFADIADRQRHIFSREVLMDARSRQISLWFPPTLTWSTEGREMQALLGDAPHRRDIECRAFWYLHSNGALSYNISLTIAYRHRIRDYYALSLLQKIVFFAEDAEGTREAAPDRVAVAASFAAAGDPDAPRLGFWPLIRGFFEADAGELLRSLVGNATWGGLWERLAQDPERSAVTTPSFHRASFLLHDRRFFALLRSAAADRNPDRRPRAAVDLAALPDEGPPGSMITYDAATLDQLDSWEPGRLALYFLSGFLRDIVDFLRQNASEVKDGTDQQAAAPDDPHFLFYVNRHAVIEVVAESRSLERGRESLGTCPYLFLVHIMAFQDEALTHLYERRVKAIVARVEAATGRPGSATRIAPRVAADLVALFHGSRLALFEEVEKHTHRNAFRYDTERGFYDAVKGARGLDERLAHWERVLARLSEAIDGLHSISQQRADSVLNRIVFWITLCSIFQVLFAATASMHAMGYHTAAADLDRVFLGVLAILLPVLTVVGVRWAAAGRPRGG